MNIITVIPLTRSKVADSLSYFTAADVPLGAVVSVPLRSKSISAIVIESRAAQDIKSEIKSAPYEIRKLSRVKATEFFPPQFMKSCKSLAEYYATNIGSIIHALVPEALLENASKISAPIPAQGNMFPDPFTAQDETYAIQGDDADRISSWRSLIRQEFARKKSISLYVPTIEDAEQMFASLEKGIEGYIFLLYGSLNKKKLVETWEKIAKTDHPIVVIATGSFSLLPRADIDTVIIERENGRGWISQRAPYLDMRHALETIARGRRRTIYLSDALLRSETLHRLQEKEIAEGSPFKWRSVSDARDYLVDMRREPPARRNDDAEAGAEAQPPGFHVLSPELKELIRKNQEESTHLFILTARRGISSITVCGDCEAIVTCANCSTPVVLHTSGVSGKNFFMCHVCGERRSAQETCVNCGSWRLTPLGIGVERVHQEIREHFPGIDVFRIDADSTGSDKEIAAAMEKFRSKPGSILLGTEIALLHLADKVDHAAIASLDSLLSLPDFRIHEKIMYTLIRLRGLSARTILLQTRRPEERVFEFGLKGNLSDFSRSQLEERKRFSYPPFSTLIKITIEGKKDSIAAEMAEIVKLLEPHEVDVFPAFTSSARGNSVIHGLLRIDPNLWPNTKLVATLRSLPPQVSVKIDPESLL